MAFRRKGWDSLTPAYRDRLKRGGINRRAYEAGAKLEKARGHAPRSLIGIHALTTKGHVIIERASVSTHTATMIAIHWNGVHNSVLHNNRRSLDATHDYSFTGREIRPVVSKKTQQVAPERPTYKVGPVKRWKLMTKQSDVNDWFHEGELRFEEIYENVKVA